MPVLRQQAKASHVNEGLPDWETKRAETGGRCASFKHGCYAKDNRAFNFQLPNLPQAI